MRRVFLLLAGVALLGAAAPRVSRQVLQNLERGFDQRVQQFSLDDPIEVLGPARALYVDKFGVVISAEVNLVVTAITPFRPQLSNDQLDKLRVKKIARLPAVRKIMRDTLVSAATTLKTLGPDEQIAVGLSFFHRPFELRQDLPAQIVMQAPRRVLADFEAGRLQAAALDAAIQEHVY